MESQPKTHEQIQQAAATIVRSMAPRLPKVGVVLGSGLGTFAEVLEDPSSIPYSSIPYFAESTVSGHAGRFVAGYCGGVPILAMQGRVHLYEGYSVDKVVLPIRTMVAAGCKVLIITNAAGGVRDDLNPGDLVLITDHINLTGHNPLVGMNDSRMGARFPDMSTAYDPELGAIAHQQALHEQIHLKEGVYCALLGPSYETPAEIRMLRTIGADLVGMSTALEVIAAHHMGARILGISCVTNLAAGLGGKLSHEEVKQTASRIEKKFIGLISRCITALKGP